MILKSFAREIRERTRKKNHEFPFVCFAYSRADSFGVALRYDSLKTVTDSVEHTGANINL
jgi:hypothetical protein